jgi:hypothetical protein
MMLKNMIRTMVCMTLLAGLCPGGAVRGEDTEPAPPGVRFEGTVCIVAEPGSTHLVMDASTFVSKGALGNGTMTLAGNPVAEMALKKEPPPEPEAPRKGGKKKSGKTERPVKSGETPVLEPAPGSGFYHADMPEFQPDPGSTMVLTYLPPGERSSLVTASAPIPSPVSFMQPESEARVRIRPESFVHVSWTGGTGPYTMTIHRSSGEKIFERNNIVDLRQIVPAEAFIQGQRYMIRVSDGKVAFSFSPSALPGTRLTLNQSATIYFTAE